MSARKPLTRLALAFILLILAFFAVWHEYSQNRVPQAPNLPVPSTRVGRWEQDIDYFGTELPRRQLDFYKLVPKERFEQEIADLRRSVPQLSNTEIALRLARLTASLGIAHTSLDLPLRGYPLWVRWYSDELGVVATIPEYRDALGARVVRIGTMSPGQLEDAVAPYISHENKAWLHAQSPAYMLAADLLHQLKMTGSNDAISLTLVKNGGQPFTLQLSLPTRQISEAELLKIQPAATPLFPEQSGRYWYKYLPDTQTLYIQYRACENDPKYPFKEFARDLFGCADSHAIRRTVVDLRFNSGGNSEVIDPLLEGLQSRPALNAKGRLFVLIGPETFSSGEMAVEEFHNSISYRLPAMLLTLCFPHTHIFDFLGGPRFNATLVGEPTGGRPNCYGELIGFKLPNSNLQVNCSTKYFRQSRDDDPPSRDPDITVARSWEDCLAGRDPVMETVLAEDAPAIK